MFLVASHINANPSSKECVIVLHGLGRTARSMSAIESALKTTGYVVMNVGYPSRKHPIETLVDQYVRPVVARCKGASTIHFVTHSMGGILTRYYLQKYPLTNLGSVVMLSPPNQGSEIVDALSTSFLCQWWLGPAFQQLSTASTSLPNTLPPPNFRLGIITGTKSINPFFSYLIPGKDDGKVSVDSARIQGATFKTVPVTHTTIMKNRAVVADILHFLATDFFVANDNKF